jgi:hypothetical protein
MSDDYLTQTQVIERGWTRTLVQRFLGEPDKQVNNSGRRGKINLYARGRVVARERDEAFQFAREKAARRSQTAKQVAQRKEAELLQQIEAMPIQIRQIKNVQGAAIRSYNDWKAECAWDDRGRYYDWKPATPDSDPAFLQRITVNFIRHELTEYDAQLESVAAQIGAVRARTRIRNRILDSIASVYPELAKECTLQKAAPDESEGA